jgi:hypothetical protein
VVWFTIILFLAVAIALIALRKPVAEMQAVIFGGRMPPGCVVAEAVTLLALALLVFLARERL